MGIAAVRASVDGCVGFTPLDGVQSARHELNRAARIAGGAHTEVVSNVTNSESLSNVKSGDTRYSRSEADARGVDAWLTEDQTHVVRSPPIVAGQIDSRQYPARSEEPEVLYISTRDDDCDLSCSRQRPPAAGGTIGQVLFHWVTSC